MNLIDTESNTNKKVAPKNIEATITKEITNLIDLEFAYNTTYKQNVSNSKINLDTLIHIIKNNEPKNYSEINTLTKSYIDNVNSTKNKQKIKNNLDNFKKYLPYFIFGGYQEIGHNNEDIQYNGCFQVDIDLKFVNGDKKAIEIKKNLSQIPYIIFAAISPSGFGVKALVKSNNINKSIHTSVGKLIIKDIATKLKIDESYFDNLAVSQITYQPYDPDIYVNYNATTFVVDFKELENTKKIQLTNSVPLESNTLIEQACIVAYNYSCKKHSSFGVPFIQSYIPTCMKFGVYVDDAIDFIKTKEILKDKHIRISNELFQRYRNTFNTSDLQTVNNFKINPLRTINILKNQYLTDTNIDIKSNCILVAPVGSGKTFWVSKQKGKKILVVPTQGLVKQCVSLYGASPFYEKSKEISDFICVTYSSFNKLSTKINLSEFDVYVDEAHNFTVSTNDSFLLRQLNEVIDLLPFAKKYVLLTATPLFNFHNTIDKLPVIKINKENTISKNIVKVKYDNLLGTIKSLVNDSIKDNYFPAILFNNTKETGTLGKIITTLESLNGDVINSTKKHTTEFNDIIVNGTINDTTDYLISTTVLKEGISITKHNDNINIIVIGKFHPIELEQFAARFRNAKNINLILLEKKDKIVKPFFFDFDTEKFLIQESANSIKDAAIKCSHIGIDLLNQTTNHFVKESIKGIEINYLSMSNFLFNREKTYLHNNYKAFNIYMEQYNWKLNNTLTNTETIEKDTLKKIKENTMKNTLEIQEIINNTLNIIASETELDNQIKMEIATDTELDIRTKVNTIANYTDFESAVEIIKNNTSNSKFNKLLKSIYITSLKNDSEFLKSSDKVAQLINNIYDTFKIGSSYNASEIKTIINNLRASLFNINNPWSKHACNLFLKTFMKVNRKQVRVKNNKHQHRFFIISHNPIDFKLNKDYILNNENLLNSSLQEFVAAKY